MEGITERLSDLLWAKEIEADQLKNMIRVCKKARIPFSFSILPALLFFLFEIRCFFFLVLMGLLIDGTVHGEPR
jgi:hypothetical protein